MVCRDHVDQFLRSKRTLGRCPLGPAKTRSELQGKIQEKLRSRQAPWTTSASYAVSPSTITCAPSGSCQ
jgi:hypothetical protein